MKEIFHVEIFFLLGGLKILHVYLLLPEINRTQILQL